MTVSDVREPTATTGPDSGRRADGEANKTNTASDVRESTATTGPDSGVDGRIAVVPVRSGILPLGGDEAVAEAGGTALLAGSGTKEAAAELAGVAARVLAVEFDVPAFGGWAGALAAVLAPCESVILPGSPDGRDLAPRLAAELQRPLLAGATEIRGRRVLLSRRQGRVSEEVDVDGPYVATLQPGVRGCERGAGTPEVEAFSMEITADVAHDAEVVSELPPDPEAIDLAEAPRILAGGAGLSGPDDFAVLTRVGAALGASIAATRVVTDHGWLPHERQIGTTGVTVAPHLYVAFGISGAVQHVAGLGMPDHVVSVNTDPSCPMMAMADLALVADAPEVLRALAARLAVDDG